MFRNVLVVFVFLCHFRGYAFQYTQGDASKEHIIEETVDKTPVVIGMHGHMHYVGQQIVSMYDEQQVKRLVSDVIRELKNTSVTAITNNNNNNNNNNNTVTKEIPQDYSVTPGVGAHKLHFKNMTWNKARLTCMREGGHLAIVNSEAENNIFLQKLQENALIRAWLGLHDLFEEGYWVTVNGETLESLGYTKWSKPEEPNNISGNQHCATFTVDSTGIFNGMDDYECTKWEYFFCEIPI